MPRNARTAIVAAIHAELKADSFRECKCDTLFDTVHTWTLEHWGATFTTHQLESCVTFALCAILPQVMPGTDSAATLINGISEHFHGELTDAKDLSS